VIVLANLVAMLIQTLSAKLGLATRKNLPEVMRDHLSPRAAVAMWLQAEAIAMATDLAEFLGAAVGINLLTGLALLPSAVAAGVAAFAILELQRFGVRLLEAVIAALVGVIGACYVIELAFAHPDWHATLRHAVTPQFGGGDAVLLSVGILGATVMPHVIYLHSALTQDRLVAKTEEDARTLLRYTRLDVVIAMSIAGVINVAMLVMAAATFFAQGLVHVNSLDRAHRTLEPILGSASSALFALALLASGLSSSAVGTLSGQVVMQGFLRRQIPVFVRRLVTMLPAFVVIAVGVDPSRTLVISQVALSFGIPFALIPLVVFTSRRDIMGPLVNRRITTVAAGVVAAVIVALNVFLLVQTTGL
jgi:manganese transport protein